MARIASDFPFAVKYGGVERQGHRDHAPRNMLLPFILNVELWNRVTVGAPNSKRHGDVLHRRMNLCGGDILKYFYLLVELGRRLAFYIFGRGRQGRGSSPRGSLSTEAGRVPGKTHHGHQSHSKRAVKTANRQSGCHHGSAILSVIFPCGWEIYGPRPAFRVKNRYSVRETQQILDKV